MLLPFSASESVGLAVEFFPRVSSSVLVDFFDASFPEELFLALEGFSVVVELSSELSSEFVSFVFKFSVPFKFASFGFTLEFPASFFPVSDFGALVSVPLLFSDSFCQNHIN